jgi:hypothetical protein
MQFDSVTVTCQKLRFCGALTLSFHTLGIAAFRGKLWFLQKKTVPYLNQQLVMSGSTKRTGLVHIRDLHGNEKSDPAPRNNSLDSQHSIVQSNIATFHIGKFCLLSRPLVGFMLQKVQYWVTTTPLGCEV